MLGLPAARAARRLLLNRQQLLVIRYPFAIRSFSISPDDKTSPKLESGYDLAAGLWRRYCSRLPKLLEYQDKAVFVDSIGILAQCWLFIQLQMPKKTHIDLLEFVEGASIASEATLRAMNSGAFPRFLAEKENSSSEVADRLKLYATPAYYNQMALQVKKNYLHRNIYVECKGVKIEKTQLADVVYRRLTEKEYEDLVNFKKPSAGMSPEASVEHLRLHVDVATVENLKVYLKDKTRCVQHQNVYRVVFESRVTDPDEVGWCIESMHIIEQKAMPRPQENAKDNKKA